MDASLRVPASPSSPPANDLDASDVAVGTKVVPRRSSASHVVSSTPAGDKALCDFRVHSSCCAGARSAGKRRRPVAQAASATRASESRTRSSLSCESSRSACRLGERQHLRWLWNRTRIRLSRARRVGRSSQHNERRDLRTLVRGQGLLVREAPLSRPCADPGHRLDGPEGLRLNRVDSRELRLRPGKTSSGDGSRPGDAVIRRASSSAPPAVTGCRSTARRLAAPSFSEAPFRRSARSRWSS